MSQQNSMGMMGGGSGMGSSGMGSSGMGSAQQPQMQYSSMGSQPQMGTPQMQNQYQQQPGGPASQPQQQQMQVAQYQQQAQLQQQHLQYQALQQQHRQQLQNFWVQQMQEIEQVSDPDFKNHQLPLARIKKIMKADEDVRMISAEAPVLFAKACEMFILELTLRSWIHTEENKRRTLQRNDIAAAITKTDIFDFLVDIVPRDDLKEEGLGVGVPRPVMPPQAEMPYGGGMYYLPAQGPPPQAPQQMMGAPSMMVGRPAMPMDPSMMYQQPQQIRAPMQYMQQPQQQMHQMWQQQSGMPSQQMQGGPPDGSVPAS